MRYALTLAEKSRGRTSPNPLVGAVIVRENRIVGEGYHKKAGEAHAEVNALKQAGELARGATLYVTLDKNRAATGGGRSRAQRRLFGRVLPTFMLRSKIRIPVSPATATVS